MYPIVQAWQTYMHVSFYYKFWSTPCCTPCFIGKKFSATVATVKCSSDCNNCGHWYNCLTFNESHFILFHSPLKLKRLFSVWRAMFRNTFPLCCVSFCLLGKILVDSHIQMAFACKRSGCARLDKMDFQRPIHAAKKRFRFVPCLENIIVHGKVAFDAARFRISPVLSKEKNFRWYP